MTEREDVLQELGDAGILDGIRWAHATAYARMLDDYDPETGHDQAWIGTTAYKLMLDRLDRVFSCGKYRLGEDDGTDVVGLDVLGAGLRVGELDAMPPLAPDLVARRDLNQSPGWVFDHWRWLLVSCPFGTARHIPWSQKSKTKQQVAKTPDPDQLFLPTTDLMLPEASDTAARAEAPTVAAPANLAVAHAVDANTGERELLLGHPRRNDKGGTAWWWTIDLLDGIAPGAAGRRPSSPTGPDSDGPKSVPDAPVRLRRPGKTGGGEA